MFVNAQLGLKSKERSIVRIGFCVERTYGALPCRGHSACCRPSGQR